jgi:5-methylcytosine-specific restriction endonuclease McrA
VDCGTPGDERNPLCGDHLVPLAKGGLSVRENVVVRCRRCNSRKGGR